MWNDFVFSLIHKCNIWTPSFYVQNLFRGDFFVIHKGLTNRIILVLTLAFLFSLYNLWKPVSAVLGEKIPNVLLNSALFWKEHYKAIPTAPGTNSFHLWNNALLLFNSPTSWKFFPRKHHKRSILFAGALLLPNELIFRSIYIWLSSPTSANRSHSSSRNWGETKGLTNPLGTAGNLGPRWETSAANWKHAHTWCFCQPGSWSSSNLSRKMCGWLFCGGVLKLRFSHSYSCCTEATD